LPNDGQEENCSIQFLPGEFRLNENASSDTVKSELEESNEFSEPKSHARKEECSIQFLPGEMEPNVATQSVRTDDRANLNLPEETSSSLVAGSGSVEINQEENYPS